MRGKNHEFPFGYIKFMIDTYYISRWTQVSGRQLDLWGWNLRSSDDINFGIFLRHEIVWDCQGREDIHREERWNTAMFRGQGMRKKHHRRTPKDTNKERPVSQKGNLKSVMLETKGRKYFRETWSAVSNAADGSSEKRAGK